MSEKLKQIIEDLDRSSLNQYVYDLLMHLPDEQKLFIRKYDNKAKNDLLHDEYSSFLHVLNNSFDAEEFVRCQYEYWDDTDALGSFIINLEQEMTETVGNITKKSFFDDAAELIAKELTSCAEYDLETDIESSDEYGGISASDCDVGNDTIPEEIFEHAVKTLSGFYKKLSPKEKSKIVIFLTKYGEAHGIRHYHSTIAKNLPDEKLSEQIISQKKEQLRHAITVNDYDAVESIFYEIKDILVHTPGKEEIFNKFVQEFRTTPPASEELLNRAQTKNDLKEQKSLLEYLINIYQKVEDYHYRINDKLTSLLKVNIKLNLAYESKAIFLQLVKFYNSIDWDAAQYLKDHCPKSREEIKEALRNIVYRPEPFYANYTPSKIRFHLLFEEFDKAFAILKTHSEYIADFGHRMPASYYNELNAVLLQDFVKIAGGTTGLQNYTRAINCLDALLNRQTPVVQQLIKEKVSYVKYTYKRRRILLEELHKRGY